MIDHNTTISPVCPYCGHESSWYEEQQKIDSCSFCGKEYSIEREYVIYYSTSKINESEMGNE